MPPHIPQSGELPGTLKINTHTPNIKVHGLKRPVHEAVLHHVTINADFTDSDINMYYV